MEFPSERELIELSSDRNWCILWIYNGVLIWLVKVLTSITRGAFPRFMSPPFGGNCVSGRFLCGEPFESFQVSPRFANHSVTRGGQRSVQVTDCLWAKVPPSPAICQPGAFLRGIAPAEGDLTDIKGGRHLVEQVSALSARYATNGGLVNAWMCQRSTHT